MGLAEVFRKRREAVEELDLRDGSELTTALARTFADDLEVLNTRLSALDERLDTLEERLRTAEGAAGLLPEHVDVLDVELRAAKLAAEIHWLSREVEHLRSGG